MNVAEVQQALARDLWQTQCRLADPLRVRTILDVGAWRGDRALKYCRSFPDARIVAIEPEPAAFALLAKLSQNHPNILAVPAAAGAEAGTAILHTNDASDTASLYPVSAEFLATGRIRPAGSYEVEVVTLDGLCRQLGIEHVDILKLDVQGAELQVLDGAWELFGAGAVRLVVAELNFWTYYDGQCWWYEVGAWLARFGFQLVAIAPEWWEGRIKFADALFWKEET